MFASTELEQLFQLPSEILRDIYIYLDPFPELIAITYAVFVTKVYKNRLGPHWTCTELVMPGITLYMSFTSFNGGTYLSDLATTPSTNRTKPVQVEEDLIVCRDELPILNILGTHELRRTSHIVARQIFYQRIKVKHGGMDRIGLRAFSDVGVGELGIDPRRLMLIIRESS